MGGGGTASASHCPKEEERVSSRRTHQVRSTGTRKRWSLVLIVAAAALAAPATIGPLLPDADAADVTVEDWEKSWDRQLEAAAKKYDSLAKKCDKNGLERTGSMVRRHALRYLPEDPELRATFGYEKRDGKWVVTNEIVRDRLKALIDDEDPNDPKFQKRLKSTHDGVAKLFQGLAARADKAAKDAAVSKDEAVKAMVDQWKELAERAWTLCIESAPPESKYADTGHKALGHPKFGGKYIWPEYLDHVKHRKDVKLAGESIAAKDDYEVGAVESEGVIIAAGFSPQGMKSKHTTVNTTHGADHAKRLCMWAERAMDDMIMRYGFPDTVKERHGLRKHDILQEGENEFRQYLEKGAKTPTARVDFLLKNGIHATGPDGEPGTRVAAAGLGASADDIVIHNTGHALTRAAMHLAASDLGPQIGHDPNAIEPWLSETITSDMSRRLTAEVLWRCISFGRYGNDLPPRPGTDVWIDLARRQVMVDDDVNLKDLWKKAEMNDLDGPSTVKGYALFQFLFEEDSAKAQKFVWHALAHGTPAAVVAVYGEWLGAAEPGEPDPEAGRSIFMTPAYEDAMDELDRRYRRWIIKSHE